MLFGLVICWQQKHKDKYTQKKGTALVVTRILNVVIVWWSWLLWTVQAKCKNLKWLSVCALSLEPSWACAVNVFQVSLYLTRYFLFDKVHWHLDSLFVLLSIYSRKWWMPLKLFTPNSASNERDKKVWLDLQSHPQQLYAGLRAAIFANHISAI